MLNNVLQNFGKVKITFYNTGSTLKNILKYFSKKYNLLQISIRSGQYKQFFKQFKEMQEQFIQLKYNVPSHENKKKW